MPNRILKESICTSETTDQLTDAEERFFTRLITQCDDYGRMDARPSILRARCFPLKLDTISDVMMVNWVNRLAEVGLIHLYTIDRRPYLQMLTWDKHQTIRAARSKWPAPQDPMLTSTCTQMQAGASKCSRNPIRNPIRESISESCETAPNGADIAITKIEKTKRTKTEIPDGFGEFWEAYPRKTARAQALKAYEKVLRAGVKPEIILAAAGNYSQECQLAARERQYICFPATFLNQGRYEDYRSPPNPAEFQPHSKAAQNGRLTEVPRGANWQYAGKDPGPGAKLADCLDPEWQP